MYYAFCYHDVPLYINANEMNVRRMIFMEDKKILLEGLKNDSMSCERCGLCRGRHNVVFGVGNPEAEVMFIGEGPGEQEDLKGEPFVGKAGILLDKMLTAIDLDRNKNIYIANIVKCRPPQNRDPQPEEQELCIAWLRRQFAIIRPKIIVCLGRIAATRIIKPDIRIKREHGQIFNKGGVIMMPVLHPAALLRNPSDKPGAFEDFLRLQQLINENCEHTYEDQSK